MYVGRYAVLLFKRKTNNCNFGRSVTPDTYVQEHARLQP